MLTSSSAQNLLQPNKVVAVATDKAIKPVRQFADPLHHPGFPAPWYGSDILYGHNRFLPPGCSAVANSEKELVKIASQLTNEFAKNDRTGMAQKLLSLFLKKQREVAVYQAHDLDLAASMHPNITSFCQTVITQHIHPALKAANWDIRRVVVPTHLGAPALNLGSKVTRTEDWGNGLTLMTNGLQHVYVVAENYAFDEKKGRYQLGLKFVLYDVFGLDNVDIARFGMCANLASNASWLRSALSAITAWWQLQHQHGYAPLVTRIIFSKEHEGATV